MNRILFITAFVPSRIAAGENFSRQVINDISRGNKVDLIFFKYRYDMDYMVESENVTVLKVFRNSSLIKLINFLMLPVLFPLFTARFNIFRLAYLRRLLKKEQYDKIVFDFSQTFLFARFIKHPSVILNCHDVIAQRYSRIYGGLLVPFVRKSEGFVLTKPDAKIFNHSEKDSMLIFQFYALRSVVTSIFLDQKVIDSAPAEVGDYFVFYANWSRQDNSFGLRWFLKTVYPSLDNKVRIKIIGAGLTSPVRKLISGIDNIEYLGFLENPYQIISNSLAIISPLFSGAGIKVKVIDSLACGTKVIGTSISFEGISQNYAQYLIQVETSLEFVSAINDFKTDINEKNNLKIHFLSSYPDMAISRYINNK